jgi:NADH-quinone oxidoreductase subunit N
VLAIVQTDVKRMLAYSSISHAGFMLVGLEAAGHIGSSSAADGVSSTLMYVALYSVLALGSFAAVSVISRGTAATSLDTFRGVAKRQPVFALGFTVLLLAQAGVPLTSGFVAKFGVIRAAVSTESYVLAVVAMVSAVIAAYLYLRIMVSMWLAEPDSSAAATTLSLPARVVLVVSVAVTLIIGVLPSFVLDVADSLTALEQ